MGHAIGTRSVNRNVRLSLRGKRLCGQRGQRPMALP